LSNGRSTGNVARSNQTARRAFAGVFKEMVCRLQQGLRNSNYPDRTTAQAIAALCVGGMVIARAMDDHKVAEGLLKASMTVALHLGNWDEFTESKREKARRPA